MSHKILLIDDDELILLSLESLLESEGYEVVTASSGAEALKTASAQTFDVFILDVIMPGMSGFEVCTALRAMDTYGHVPIVMLTAKSTDADRERGLASGATRFLPKPIDPDKLLEILQSVLAEP
jgi:two-component system cell cycle response regulator